MTDLKSTEITSTEKLLAALTSEFVSQTEPTKDKMLKLMQEVREFRYHDYKSISATPCIDLVRRLRELNLHSLANRAMSGEFDATKAESDEWAESKEGKEAINSLPPGMRDFLFGK